MSLAPFLVYGLQTGWNLSTLHLTMTDDVSRFLHALHQDVRDIQSEFVSIPYAPAVMFALTRPSPDIGPL